MNDTSQWTEYPLGFKKEVLGPHMTRWHITPWKWWPFKKRLYIHKFSEPDLGSPPHNHPMNSTSFILYGGYVEEVWSVDGTCIEVERKPGQFHEIPATHIHRIIELPKEKAWTIVARGEDVQTWRFYPELSPKIR